MFSSNLSYYVVLLLGFGCIAILIKVNLFLFEWEKLLYINGVNYKMDKKSTIETWYRISVQKLQKTKKPFVCWNSKKDPNPS